MSRIIITYAYRMNEYRLTFFCYRILCEKYAHTMIAFQIALLFILIFSTVRRALNRGKTGHVNFDRLMSNGRHRSRNEKTVRIQ